MEKVSLRTMFFYQATFAKRTSKKGAPSDGMFKKEWIFLPHLKSVGALKGLAIKKDFKTHLKDVKKKLNYYVGQKMIN